eukprot:356918_1
MRLGCLHRSIYQTIHVSSANLQKRFITSQAANIDILYEAPAPYIASILFPPLHLIPISLEFIQSTRDWQSLLCDEASIVPITKTNSILISADTYQRSFHISNDPSIVTIQIPDLPISHTQKNRLAYSQYKVFHTTIPQYTSN